MRQVKKGSTSISVDVYIIDATNGTPELGVLFNTAGLDLEYRRDGAAVTDIVEVTLALLTTAWASGGFLEIGHGYYRLDVPNAAFATGASKVTIQGTVTGMIVLPQSIQLVDFDPEDTVNLGLTNLDATVASRSSHAPTAIVSAGPITTLSGAVVNVDLADTVTTLTNKTGFSLGATGLDAITEAAIGMVEIAKVVWNRVLTGVTHNIQNSAGRRIRIAEEVGTYDGGLVWLDTNNGFAGTIDFENGTEVRPSSTLADALTILGSVNLGLHGIHVAESTSITFTTPQSAREWAGVGWTLALGGQSIGGSTISGAIISGVSTGAPISVKDCFINSSTFAGGDFVQCALGGDITLSGATSYYFFQCYHASSTSPAIDFGVGVLNTIVHLHAYHGAVTIRNMGNATFDTLHFDSSGGKLTLDASCVGGTINMSGTFELVDNSSGMTLNRNGDAIKVLGVPAGASISIDNAAIKAETALIVGDTVDIQARIPAALIGGRMNSDVQAMANDIITAASIATDALGSLELAQSAIDEISDGFLDRDMGAGTDSGTEAIRTPRQALRFLRNKWSIAAGTLTVRKENDITASWTSTVTTSAGNPVSQSDPADV